MRSSRRTARFEVLTAVIVKITIFWNETPCSLVDLCQRLFYLVGGGSMFLLNVG
jgi:hypothetical protein